MAQVGISDLALRFAGACARRPGIIRGMSSATSVRAAAMQLARQERADLARQLIVSLDEDADAVGEDVEAAWLAEVEQRLATAERAPAKFEPWEVAQERIAARLRDMGR